MLGDLRGECADLLDGLLSERFAALAKAGLVNLETLAQDGVEGRGMKMAERGLRPANKVQVTSGAGEQFVTDIKVCNTGSDRGLMRPMLERQRTRPGGLPKRYLVDGGFGSAEDIEWAHAE